MALTRVSGRVVYPHGNDTPTPVTGDGVIEYVHATPGIIDGAVHGPDRTRIGYVAGVAEDAWLKPGMWRAYVYPVQGRSYTLHLGIPEGGETTIADAVGEVVPEGIITKGDPGPPGASVTGGRDLGDGRVVFTLSDGKETEPVQLPPGPAGRGIASISEADENSVVTITYTDDTTSTVKAIRGADGHSPAITWDGTVIVTDGTPGPDLKGEPGTPGADSTVPGPPGPPGAVPTAADYLVVGPGRPDAPTTTGLSATQIAALPVGCEYRSTDGASVGAWVWMKRATGWAVTEGDTGWLDVTASATSLLASGKILVRRKSDVVHWRFIGIKASGSGRILEAPNVMSAFTAESATLWPPQLASISIPVWLPGQASSAPSWVNATRSTTYPNGALEVPSAISTWALHGEGSYVTARPFPTTLPGTPTS